MKDMTTIPYEEKSMGTPSFPAGFEAKLRGKTLEEQMACYRITEITEISSYSYGSPGESRTQKTTFPLVEYSGCRGLVVKDGLLVGVSILAYDRRPRACLAGQGVCTYFSSDDDGTGGSSRSDCTRLDCVV